MTSAGKRGTETLDADAEASSLQGDHGQSGSWKPNDETSSFIFPQTLSLQANAAVDDEASSKATRDVLMDPDAVVPDVLCPKCRSLFNGSTIWHRSPESGSTASEVASHTAHCRRFQTLGETRQVSGEGCHLCAAICSRIDILDEEPWGLARVENHCDIATGLRGASLDGFDTMDSHIDLLLLCGWFDTGNGPGRTGEPVFEIRVYTPSADPKWLFLVAYLRIETSKMKRTRNLYDNKSGLESQFNMNWMASRLSQCQDKHAKCNIDNVLTGAQNRQRGPRRLLDISNIHTSRLVKLVDYGDLAEGATYVAISHRWGDELQLLLTIHTQESLYSGMPLVQLPRLFQDISSLSSRLGYKYLWIDTLCIQQDDKDDWQVHAEQMSSIYAESSLSIAASTSLHHQPLLWPRRNMLALTDLCVTPTWTQFDQVLLVLRGSRLEADPLNEEPIAKRGWTFQERLLAPRTLHFAKEQVVWECREYLARNWDSWLQSVGDEKPDQPKQRLISLLESDELHPDTVLQFWVKQLSTYSRTVTKFDEDRLFALAGIANMFHTLFLRQRSASSDGTYYAGMWRHRLELQLCWKVSGNLEEGQTPRPISYRAPSWSWASVNGKVRFAPWDPDYNSRADSDLLVSENASTNARSLIRVPEHGMKVHFGDSTFGPVQKGSMLVLWTNLCRVSIAHRSTTPGNEANDLVNVTLFRSPPAHKERISLWKSDNKISNAWVWWDDRLSMRDNGDATNSELFLMPLVFMAQVLQRDGYSDCSHLWGRSEFEPAITADESTIHAVHHPQFYASTFHFDCIRNAFEAGHKRGAQPENLRFGFYIDALLLQREEGYPGRYRRIGLCHVQIRWFFHNTPDTELARGFMNAFRVPEDFDEDVSMLSKPIPDDPSVYEIELV